MQMIHSKNILGTPFRITTESVQNSPGTWNSTKVSIYRDSMYDLTENKYHQGLLIGEYLRNYSSFGHETFCPFQIDGQWYALYSASYTATRVLKLHNDRIEDWCGEESHSHGFCPVEFYVPRIYHVQETYTISGTTENRTHDLYYSDSDYSTDDIQEFVQNPGLVDVNYCNFGFLSGCVWGDDTSWKLRYIDLSKVPDKVLTITEKFGYWELPEGPLKSHIRMDSWEPGVNYIVLHKQQYVNLDEDIS